MKFEDVLPDADGIRRAAAIEGPYRYVLMRSWNLEARHLVWIMLNPSTADGVKDDPTLRRCIDFTRRWGYGGLAVLNLYAWRSSSPDVLRHAPDPIGPRNLGSIIDSLHGADVILAWGADAGPVANHQYVVSGLALRHARSVAVLGRCSNGHPRHPLYVRASAAREFLKVPAA